MAKGGRYDSPDERDAAEEKEVLRREAEEEAFDRYMAQIAPERAYESDPMAIVEGKEKERQAKMIEVMDKAWEDAVRYGGIPQFIEQAAPKQNPKHIRAQKDGKAPLEYLVYSVLEGDARVHKSGADKYGVRNWRRDKILTSTYEGAILRHFKAWAEGEDIDPDSGEPHLLHIRACCAIVLDAQEHGTLIDDRDRCESKEP
jgi:hypothetical protein